MVACAENCRNGQGFSRAAKTANLPNLMTDCSHHFRFPRSHRLSGNNEFAAVFNAKMRKHAGPLTLVTKPNDLPHNRLGLSVSRKVGKAVVRNRIKRLLRDAFRLTQHDQPAGYDIVVIVRPNQPVLPLAEYQTHLMAALQDSHKTWQRRQRRNIQLASEKRKHAENKPSAEKK